MRQKIFSKRSIWRVAIALVLAAFLVPVSSSPVAAISISEYFEISYEPVKFVDANGDPKTEVYGDEIFYARIRGSATCTKDLPFPYNQVSEVRATSRVIAKHKINGSEQTLNSSYTITIKPFPKKEGDTTQIEKDIPLQFPDGSQSGDYNVRGELIKAEAKTFLGWQDITSYFPQSQPMGSVTYITQEDICTLTMAIDGHGSTTPTVGSHIYPCGTVVDITATSNECWEFVNWTGDVADTSSASTTVTVDSGKTVTAHFGHISYTLTVSSDGCCSITVGELGTVAPNSTEEFNITCGTEVTLEAMAGECCDFDEWKVDGSSVEGNPITVTMDSNHSVTATGTEPVPYNLTVNIEPEGAGTVSLDPIQSGEGYACGTNVQLTATPNECYTFSHWSGALSGSANPATIHMDSDKNVTAHFNERSYTLMVSADGCCPITVGELGTVAPNSTEEFTIACGTEVTLEAVADECCDFDEWKVDGNSVEGNPITVSMDSAHTAVAYCTVPRYTIIASTGEGGSISPSGNVTVNCGADQTFTITPDECYKIEDVLVDGGSVGAVSSYTFRNVTVARTISATFAETIHTLLTVNVSPEGSGNIKVNGDIPESYPAEYTLNCGTDVNLTAIPNESYTFSHWSGALSGSANPTSIHMDSDKEVTAIFSKTQEMHIASIQMALKSGGIWIFKYTYATATITIVDAGDNPVEGAQISGYWSGATSDSDSGTTDSDGKVPFSSNSVRNAPDGTTFTFTVDDVSKSDWEYDSDASVKTKSITVGGTPSPTISFSPSSFSFTAAEGGANPADQALSIWNSGGGTLNWSISDDVAWLGLSPTSGSSTGETNNVTLSVDISGMAVGNYDATIIISATGATNTPQTTPVSVEIIAPDTTPPTISNVKASNITTSSATITWRTNEVADSKVEYGKTTSYGSSKSATSLVTSHSITLAGLEPETTYHYKVTSADSSANQASSVDFTFATLEQPQNTMHIANIDMGLKSGGFWFFKYTYATATVTVVDAEDNSVAGVQVSGYWSGATSDSDSGATNSDGKIAFSSNNVRNAVRGTAFTFTVDDVTKSGWTYDRAANIETSNSITVNPGSSGGFFSNILSLVEYLIQKVSSMFS